MTVLVIVYGNTCDKYRTDTNVVRTTYYSSTVTQAEEASNPYHIYSSSDLLQTRPVRGNLKTMGLHACLGPQILLKEYRLLIRGL
jgi:hypothetical protein